MKSGDTANENKSEGEEAENHRARFPVIRGGISPDPDLQKKRETVRQVGFTRF